MPIALVPVRKAPKQPKPEADSVTPGYAPAVKAKAERVVKLQQPVKGWWPTVPGYPANRVEPSPMHKRCHIPTRFATQIDYNRDLFARKGPPLYAGSAFTLDLGEAVQLKFASRRSLEEFRLALWQYNNADEGHYRTRCAPGHVLIVVRDE